MNTNAPYELPPVSLLEPNDSAQGDPGSLIRLRELLDTEAFRESSAPLTVPVGVHSTGKPLFFDIEKMPHLIITGRTGAGKSMWLRTVMTGLLCKNSPDKVTFLLIDPKMTAFDDYSDLPHLAMPIAKGPQEGVDALKWAVDEMGRRCEQQQMQRLHKQPGLVKELYPPLVIMIDELADLMMTAPDQVEEAICNLLWKGRSVGMHLLIATQCPRPDILTGLMLCNIPTRIAFAAASQEDSLRTLETAGAEALDGPGDMLFLPVNAMPSDALNPFHLQGAYVSRGETKRIVAFIKEHNGEKAE